MKMQESQMGMLLEKLVLVFGLCIGGVCLGQAFVFGVRVKLFDVASQAIHSNLQLPRSDVFSCSGKEVILSHLNKEHSDEVCPTS